VGPRPMTCGRTHAPSPSSAETRRTAFALGVDAWVSPRYTSCRSARWRWGRPRWRIYRSAISLVALRGGLGLAVHRQGRQQHPPSKTRRPRCSNHTARASSHPYGTPVQRNSSPPYGYGLRQT
jgi:hypothetical protein